ncbi:MAG TPA: methyltransferase domain-containing protein, partial [Puia sp.]|nr:methyltransferase domain-containing protein [Puia sp.]
MMNRDEEQVALAFTRQAEVFDDLFSDNTIVQYKRKRVRALLRELLPEPSNVLELNSGTGEDALWLASQGYMVHATDIAPGMQQVLHYKVKAAGLAQRISQECCSFTQLQNLKNKGPYQLIFSNFAGLNCTDRLGQVLLSLEPLLQ